MKKKDKIKIVANHWSYAGQRQEVWEVQIVGDKRRTVCTCDNTNDAMLIKIALDDYKKVNGA